MNPIELGAAVPLAVLAVILGFFPPALTPWIDAGVQALLEAVKITAGR